ncbi:unnamed protein product [Schistosoma mattheei]|uniref:Uncharacterized protein n=1 Tax=Schistosoma mattheei TaxID=31246 RepID=A0A183PEB3_9TREM|nr:unnamed protein product [Schistosoma mattheei]
MELAMDHFGIHLTFGASQDYVESFEIWSMTRKDIKDDKIVAHFLTFIGTEAYCLLKSLAYPEKPISPPVSTLKELSLNHSRVHSFVDCVAIVECHHNLKDAYLQITLDQSPSISTTINTPCGLFKYSFLPFGLTCSPVIYQKVMNKVVSGLDVVEFYQDELIVHDFDKVVHDQRLIALFRRLIQKNITVNTNKCSFCVSSFECLRYLVDSNGFRPDIERLAPLTSCGV